MVQQEPHCAAHELRPHGQSDHARSPVPILDPALCSPVKTKMDLLFPLLLSLSSEKKKISGRTVFFTRFLISFITLKS